jgi:hypothetical protein
MKFLMANKSAKPVALCAPMNIDKLNDRTRVYYAKNLKKFTFFMRNSIAVAALTGSRLDGEKCLRGTKSFHCSFLKTRFEVNKFSKSTVRHPESKTRATRERNKQKHE